MQQRSQIQGEIEIYLINLNPELPCRNEDKHPGPRRFHRPVEQPLEHRQHVGGGLAGASGGATADVAAKESNGNCGGLKRNQGENGKLFLTNSTWIGVGWT